MNTLSKSKLFAAYLGFWMALTPMQTNAEDIDIFTGASAGTASSPNILIILDNSANWSKASQKWPGGIVQGQAETNAINTVINSLGAAGPNVNIGLMEYGKDVIFTGYMRFAVKPMTGANIASFGTQLNHIYGDINGPTEKVAMNNWYGDLMHDAYNYFGGLAPVSPGTPDGNSPDAAGYTSSAYTQFVSPLSISQSCASNFIILIGNPAQSGPRPDTAANSCALAGLNDTTCPSNKFSPQLALPNFTATTTTTPTTLGTTAQCYTGAQVTSFNTAISTCLTAGTANCYATSVDASYINMGGASSSSATDCSPYTNNCSIGTAAISNTCAAGELRYSVIKTTTTGTSGTSTAPTTNCFASSATGADYGSLSCPAGSTCTYSTGAAASSCAGTPIASTAPTTSCYASSATGADYGSLTCPAGSTCTYATGAAASSCAGTPIPSTAPTTSCYASSATGADYGSLTCPAGSTCTYSTGASASACTTGTAGTSTASTTYYYPTSATGADHGSLTCPAGSTCTYSTGATAAVGTSLTTTATTTSCYSGYSTGSNKWTNSTDYGGLTCPTGYTCTFTSTDTGHISCGTSPATYKLIVTRSDATNYYTITQTAATVHTGDRYLITQAATPASTGNRYTITQTATPGSGTNHYTITQTSTAGASSNTLGYTAACYASAPASTGDYAASCTGAGISCTYGNNPTTNLLATACADTTKNKYPVIATNVVTTNTPTGTSTVDTATYNMDEWARFLFQKGVPYPAAPLWVSGTTYAIGAYRSSPINQQNYQRKTAGAGTTDPSLDTTNWLSVGSSSKAKVTTYAIDVYNAQPDATETSLYLSTAKFGGGKYFKAGSESEIAAALTKILAEVQSVNSTFASASLPVNSTNRAQNANQVFIGMFRPDPNANPRWFGNLKQYQIGSNGVTLDLYDNAPTPKPAINVLTGFLDDCAQSFWTSDSPTPNGALPWIASHYWGNIATDSPAGTCPSSSYNLFSDIPDGAFVEKGAVAEVLRKGNDPATTNTTPTWSFNRNMYTLGGGALADFSQGTLSLGAFNFTQGKDVANDSSLTTWTSSTNIMRHTVHGDVIHSRPLPVNYGTSSAPNAGVTAYYGANDGTFRAVAASGSNAGKELWAFVAPEFSSTAASRNTASSTNPLTRLMNNSPPVNYPVTPAVVGGIPKDYFFDGSTGVYQNADNSKVWIYPAMRRGGRMIYAFDVTNSAPSSTVTPKFTFKWRAGCPNLTNDTGCADGTGAGSMTDIGQTWSTPAPAFVKGYSMTTPVVVVGGGYDACEDADVSAPSCASGKGHAVYVFDADTGALLRKFTDANMRSVVTDAAFLDPNNNGDVDYAYIADTGGNIYRINFLDPVTNAYLDKDHWTIQRIAYTSGGGRKFQWMPGLLPSSGKVYVAIASGDREHPLQSNYPYTAPVTNRLYVYLDDLASTDINLDGASMSDFTTNTACTTPGILTGSTNTNKGWFMNFPELGEQAVTSAVIAGGMVTVSTNRSIPPAAGTCSTSLGEARGYWVNLFNASGAVGIAATCGSADRFGTFAGGGLPPSPVFGTVPINGVPTTVLIGAIQRGGGASSPIAPQILRPSIQPTRQKRYWKNSGDN